MEDGERLRRATKREGKQSVPNYNEVCRRFLADEEDFSEENILKSGISRRFENENLDICTEEIKNYIRSEMAGQKSEEML